MKKHRKQYLIVALALVVAFYAAVVVVPNIIRQNKFLKCEQMGNVLDSNPPQCVQELPASCIELVIDDGPLPDCEVRPIREVRSIWLPW